MSTKDIENEASVATDALLALSEAGKAATKKRKKEIKAARKRQSQIAYAAKLAARAEQDKIDEAQEVLSQIDPDQDEEPAESVTESVVEPPTPEPAAPVVAEPEPKVVDLNPELEKENEELRKKVRELEDQPAIVEPPTPEPAAPVVAEPEPKEDDTKPLSAVSDANPTTWGLLALILAFVGLWLGWAYVGPEVVDLVPERIWDWFASLGRPITAVLGFFGGGWLGQTVERWYRSRRTEA